jgi:hypothetical protein
MRRNALLIVSALLSLPLLAQAQPVPACNAPAGEAAPLVLLEPGQDSPSAVPILVAGPGGSVSFTYLPYCWMCTLEMPCDTECGWDPGKGGPVTCGENGAPCGGR